MLFCSEVSKSHRRDQDVAAMVLDMTSRLIPHLHAASERAECCMETVANTRTTLVNTFGVYWTKRGDFYNLATRCAIVRCMTDFILVSVVYACCCLSAEYDAIRQWLCVFRLHCIAV